jgi:hypothetical protein
MRSATFNFSGTTSYAPLPRPVLPTTRVPSSPLLSGEEGTLFLMGGPCSVLFLFVTLVTGPRESLSLELSDTRVYAPQILARLGTTAHWAFG